MSYQMQDNIQYAPPPGPPPGHTPGEYYEKEEPGNYNGGYNADPERAAPNSKQTFAQAFKLKSTRYNDKWAGILFLCVVICFAGLSGFVIQRYNKYHTFNGGTIYSGANNFSLNTNTLILLIFVVVVAFVISWCYFLLAMKFPKVFIWTTGILNVVLGFATAIYYIKRGQYGGGITLLVFAVLGLVAFISWIPRIPFSAVMLRTAGHVARYYGHIFMVSGVSGVIALALSSWFSVTLVAIYAALEPGSDGNPNPACSSKYGCGSAKVIGGIVVATFCMYWISEWLKYTIYTTIAGVYGSWYFYAGKPCGLPSHVTRGALRRATTYSFGSISFGSLILAFINTARQICSMAQANAEDEGNFCGAAFACVLGCLIQMLQGLAQLFNRYAYSHIALYGKRYMDAARDTWKMLKDRGFDAFANDCLVGPVISMGAVFVAYLDATGMGGG
ncbi:putative choline transporter, neither null mutation nor overexpression affects choline transport [Ascosphaera atra]|nr:putative choline transporter, neither null mutation nor overexpression affects choline transport [Ascosphaera atra]